AGGRVVRGAPGISGSGAARAILEPGISGPSGPCMFSVALLPECPVNEPTFQQIARFPVIQEFEESFRQATGVSLALVPPEEPTHRRAFGRRENGFCTQA